MKLGPHPENAMELLAGLLNLVPTPVLDTHVAFTRARAIMAGTALGMFDALEHGPRLADDVAAHCGTHPRATQTLLDCLAGAGYLKRVRGKYANSRKAARWLVSSSPYSLKEKLIFQQAEWNWVGSLEDFVKTGRSVALHERMTEEQWGQYQRGMRSMSVLVSREVALRTSLPRHAVRMLDIGGSHGLHSVALCRRHPRLTSTILELPKAIPHANTLLARENMGPRVHFRPGDALTSDLGVEQYDLIIISQLAHHFTAHQNASLVVRSAAALKPKGRLVIQEFHRPAPGNGEELAQILGLYFALTSTSGTWSVEDMARWQRDAGLAVKPPVHLRSMPGLVQIVGQKRNGTWSHPPLRARA